MEPFCIVILLGKCGRRISDRGGLINGAGVAGVSLTGGLGSMETVVAGVSAIGMVGAMVACVVEVSGTGVIGAMEAGVLML